MRGLSSNVPLFIDFYGVFNKKTAAAAVANVAAPVYKSDTIKLTDPASFHINTTTVTIGNMNSYNIKNATGANEEPPLPSLLLSDMDHWPHYFALSDLLDERSAAGGDYRQLAALHGFSQEDIDRLALAPFRGLRPTEQLLRILNQRLPDLRVYDVELKCVEMHRMDVVAYIREKVYNTAR